MKKLIHEINDFVAERDWEQFHSIKNLALGLNSEVGELSDIIRWLKDDELIYSNIKEAKLLLIKEEVADIFYYLLRISYKLNIDLEEVLLEKLEGNRKKYPIIDSKGNPTKYNLK